MDKRNIVAHACQRILSILVAIPMAVVAGFATVCVLDAILPRSKPWGVLTMFLITFIAAAYAGIVCMRAIGPSRPMAHSEEAPTKDDRQRRAAPDQPGG
jgi:F0F1-type ATP synthase assembly protein I